MKAIPSPDLNLSQIRGIAFRGLEVNAAAIGETARASGVSAKMIRYSKSIELVRPAARSAATYRSYAAAVQTPLYLTVWQDGNRSSGAVKAVALAQVAKLAHRNAALQAATAAIERSAEPARLQAAALR